MQARSEGYVSARNVMCRRVDRQLAEAMVLAAKAAWPGSRRQPCR